MASGGGADSSTGRTATGRRKRPSSASLDDQATRLQEEDFTW